MKQTDIDDIITFLEELGEDIQFFTIIAAIKKGNSVDVVVKSNEDKDLPLYKKLETYAQTARLIHSGRN